MNKGVFITIDGIHGSGKTTVVSQLYKLFSEDNLSVIKTKEIGGSSLGEEIIHLLPSLDYENDVIPLIFLILASRAKHVKEVIKPFLKKDFIVITDRFYPSTFVYQNYCIPDMNKNYELLKKMNDFSTGGLNPSCTFILDLPAKEAIERKKGSNALGYWEKLPIQFHEKARNGFLELAKLENWYVVDASQTINQIISEITRKLQIKHLISSCY